MSLVRSKKPPLLRLPPSHIQSSSTSATQQQSKGMKLPLPPDTRSGSRLPEVPEERRTDVLLGDLEKKESLGQGSGGKVFKVVHTRTGTVYALKTIHVQRADAAISKQIMREQEISRRSMSPYVVKCYGVFDQGGEISLVLEYMDGGTLAHVLERHKTIPEQYLAKITVDVLKGLVYLHSNRVVHRDIKPSNLLLNSKGEVKIADFGVSTELANTMAQCDSFVGTCAYMSPERFQLDVHGGFNYSADIWSLGLVLLECALGRYPYLSTGQRPDWVTLMCNICNWEIPCSPQETAHMSEEFRDLVKVCLHKDPKRRPGAIQLLQHPFIKKFEGVLQNCDLKPLLR